MTLREWLSSNDTFSEAVAIDRNRNEFIWVDEKPYNSEILNVVAKGDTVIITLNYEKD